MSTENAKLIKATTVFPGKIDLLYVQNVQQDEEINQLKKKLHLADSIQPNSSLDGEDRKMKINSADNLISDDSSPRLPPSSCWQLSTIGHYLDGIYLIANQETNKIETVYCDFGSSTRKMNVLTLLA